MTAIQKLYKDKLLFVFMMKTIFGALILIGLISLIGASSSSTAIVNFTIHPYNSSLENNSFNGSVSNLKVDSRTKNSISWVWKNNEEGNFSYNLVFLDRILVMNGTKEIFNDKDLKENKCYEIGVVSIGKDGSEGPRVSDVACTLREKRVRHSRGIRVINDTVLDFFVENKSVSDENTIILGNSVSENKGFDWMILLCCVLGLLILFLAFLIVIISKQ